jgi:hypothetical protein
MKKAIKATWVVSVVWEQAPESGSLTVINGTLAGLQVAGGQGRAASGKFGFKTGPGRLDVMIGDAQLHSGPKPTTVRIEAGRKSFAFFLRDVNSGNPIFIPLLGAGVLPAADLRTYTEVKADVQAKGHISIHQAIEAAPEETYEEACAVNRQQMCPTWLGLSRDMRFFDVAHRDQMGYWGYVQARYHSVAASHRETKGQAYRMDFVIGQGSACRIDIERRLEEGCLPILRSIQHEEAINYHVTAFATLETGPISKKRLRGTEWEACYPNMGGQMLKPDEIAKIKDLIDYEMHGREEETVCWVRVEAVNTAPTPAYAWFKTPMWKHDGVHGFSVFDTGEVLCVNRLDGQPTRQNEMAVLLPPGGKAVLDMLVPHQPLSTARALKLAQQDFNQHLTACRTFWKGRLASASSISVPEPAIDERIKAGLLHCDIATFGKEPSGSLLASIGFYAPIGSESSPIIQFFDSMGWHQVAERALQFFLDRQREDGFIQNFGGYQLETGPALWSMGEHYRYTHDKAWVRRIKTKVLKSCDFLLAWRERNKRKELRGCGYGMLDGKVADPEDFFHSFMLNGLSYLGIARVAEMLKEVDPPQSKRLAKEAAAFRKDIRTAYYESIGRSPVIPLGDGTWTPTVAPWTEYPGPLTLFADGGDWFSHGTIACRDSMIGSLYLVIGEVLEPHEMATEALLRTNQQLYTVRNAGLSQPYYCRHDHLHLIRDEVKEFLKTYYNQFTGLQDRETYTFWEHYFGASQHKTHEEGWFMMQTRWMLWMEQGDRLHLLKAIPRRWLENGKQIELRDVASYFGKVSLKVESKLADGTIEADVVCSSARRPSSLVVRLPHPEYRKPIRVEGGSYHPKTESVIISGFKGKAHIRLTF